MDLYFFGFVILVAGATWFLRNFQNGGDGNDQIDQVPENIGKYHLTSYRINLLIIFCQVLPEVADKLLNALRSHPSFQPAAITETPQTLPSKRTFINCETVGEKPTYLTFKVQVRLSSLSLIYCLTKHVQTNLSELY